MRAHRSHRRQTATMSAAPRVTSFSEDSLREWFGQYNQDGTGLMDEAALGQLCAQLGLDPHSAPDIMQELDTDRDGKVGRVGSLAAVRQEGKHADAFTCSVSGGAVHCSSTPAGPPSDHLRRRPIEVRFAHPWGGGGGGE